MHFKFEKTSRSPLYFRHLTAASSNPEHNSQINPIITNSKAQKIRYVASSAFNPQLNTESCTCNILTRCGRK